MIVLSSTFLLLRLHARIPKLDDHLPIKREYCFIVWLNFSPGDHNFNSSRFNWNLFQDGCHILSSCHGLDWITKSGDNWDLLGVDCCFLLNEWFLARMSSYPDTRCWMSKSWIHLEFKPFLIFWNHYHLTSLVQEVLTVQLTRLGFKCLVHFHIIQ